MYNNTEKEVDIFKVIHYGHIPEVAAFLAKKLDRRSKKGGGTIRKIQSFEAACAGTMTKLYVQQYVAEVQQGLTSLPPLYWFELTQYQPHDWRITHIEPHPPAHTQPYVVLPGDIIEELGKNLVIDPDKVVTHTGMMSRALKKKVDVRVVRYSANFIMGTVRDHPAKTKKGKKTAAAEVKPPDTTGITHDRAQAFRSFYQMMAKGNSTEFKEMIRDIILPMLPRLKEDAEQDKRGLPERIKAEYSRYPFLNIVTEEENNGGGHGKE
jgi:hypothetical protein